MDLTYGMFLLIFVIIPTLFFSAAIVLNTGFQPNLYRFLWVGVIAIIAFIWTPIWDNYLVANKVWWYDTELVWNIIIGVVPLEEYMFFVLQPMFVGIYLIAMIDLIVEDRAKPKRMKFNIGINLVSVILVGALWILSVAFFLFLYGNPVYDHLTYLALIVVWSFPPVMVQLFYGADILLHYRKLLGFVILSASIYLSAADCVAIYRGIWTISESKSIGNVVPGVLPFEEAFFFLITNVLCVFGCSFYLLPESRERMKRTIECLSSKNQKKTV